MEFRDLAYGPGAITGNFNIFHKISPAFEAPHRDLRAHTNRDGIKEGEADKIYGDKNLKVKTEPFLDEPKGRLKASCGAIGLGKKGQRML